MSGRPCFKKKVRWFKLEGSLPFMRYVGGVHRGVLRVSGMKEQVEGKYRERCNGDSRPSTPSWQVSGFQYIQRATHTKVLDGCIHKRRVSPNS